MVIFNFNVDIICIFLENRAISITRWGIHGSGRDTWKKWVFCHLPGLSQLKNTKHSMIWHTHNFLLYILSSTNTRDIWFSGFDFFIYIVISNSICFLVNVRNSLLVWLNNIPLCIHTCSLFNDQLMDIQIDCLCCCELSYYKI